MILVLDLVTVRRILRLLKVLTSKLSVLLELLRNDRLVPLRFPLSVFLCLELLLLLVNLLVWQTFHFLNFPETNFY